MSTPANRRYVNREERAVSDGKRCPPATGTLKPVEVCAERLRPGDFIERNGDYGEVTKVRGPHGPLGTPPTTDWYTLRVRWDGDRHDTTVGPWRGNRLVKSWSHDEREAA